MDVNSALFKAQRQAAELEYPKYAFDYERNSVGSRDWSLFWKGWQACVDTTLHYEQKKEAPKDAGISYPILTAIENSKATQLKQQRAQADYEMRRAAANFLNAPLEDYKSRDELLIDALQEALAEMKIAKAGLIGHGRAVLDAAIAKAADALEKAGAP